ncbi:TonB-dependent receptor [Novosphingobium umbonatum]|uniref:TonB-dependent receptor n=1 Tax=Novosphingobium umbonatum TaxID=1908524 RepID=A0A437MZW2_9SPHN|nr:TonB-dependent receptor [Novosphingobium umbonatum]RVU03211.1 TonB-dependent receptor [Novosphingobium umbonatum]
MVTRYMLASVSLLALPAAALAQSSAPEGGDAGNPAKPAEIIVTGSRIATGNSSPVPLTVVTTENLLNVRPSTLADTLQSVPVLAGSRSTLSSPTSFGGSGAGNGAANQVNLRNLGAQRNLVLMDGHRVPPTSTTNVVDIDMVPQMLLDRVETVTGGASAVYGSDAISGVVNFITKKNFNGLKTNLQYGISRYGDGQQVSAGMAYGTKLFDGRGHFEASYEFRDDKGVMSRSSRPWFQRLTTSGAGTAANPFYVTYGVNSPNLPFGGRISGTSSALNGMYFSANGVLSPFVNGSSVISPVTGVADASLQVGGAGGYYDTSLKASLRSHQFFGRFDFDVSDSLKFYITGAANLKKNRALDIDLTLNNLTIRSSNAYIAQMAGGAYASALAAAGSTFNFSRIVQGVPLDQNTDSTQISINTGLDGALGKFKWNVNYTHGQTHLYLLARNNVNEQKLRASLDAVNVGGNIVCGINADAIASNDDASCRPWNPFGPSASDASAMGYFLTNSTYTQNTYLDDLSADIHGPLVEGWAGPISGALSVEWRQDRFNSHSYMESNDLANCAGLLNCVQGRQGLWRNSFASSPTVSNRVWEVSAETEVPLLTDQPFAKSLSLSGAARYTSYKTSGQYWTWKLGGVWEVDNDFRLRGTLSRDIRAPTLNDLFAPTSTVTNAQTDYLIAGQPSYAVAQDTKGNPNLTAEVGHTLTVGGVWRPSFARGLSLSLDYYQIKISNAVILSPGFSQIYQQACYASGGTSPFCSLQTRALGNYTDTSAANVVTRWSVQPFNIGSIRTFGLDGEVNYTTRLVGRPVTLRVMGTYQPHIYYEQAGVQTTDQGGVTTGPVGMGPAPKLRITSTMSYKVSDAFRVDVQNRWRSPMHIDANPANVYYNGMDHVKAGSVTSVNLSYTMNKPALGNPELFFNVQNLFDAAPAYISGSNPAGRIGGFTVADDPVGRYFTFGLRNKF